jgi:hypothetical protein
MGRSGASNWKPDEVKILLDAVESILPLGEHYWHEVVTEVNSSLPADQARNIEACRLKFKNLRSVKKPTGDPSIPPVRKCYIVCNCGCFLM